MLSAHGGGRWRFPLSPDPIDHGAFVPPDPLTQGFRAPRPTTLVLSAAFGLLSPVRYAR